MVRQCNVSALYVVTLQNVIVGDNMKTHIILLELTQESEKITWLEHVLLSGLNQGESIKLKKLAEINDILTEITGDNNE